MALDSSTFDVTKLRGDTITINSQTVTVLERDSAGNVLRCQGTVTITDGASGYAKGCLYIKTDVAAGTTGLYENVGITTSCNFDAIVGGGTPTGRGLDEAYDINPNVTVDSGPSTWTDSSAGALNTFAFVKDGAGSGNVLDFSIDAALTGTAIALDMNLGIAAGGIAIDCGAGARTGTDVYVNDDSTGLHVCFDVASSGSGESYGYRFTGSYTGSPGGAAFKMDLNNDDNLDSAGLWIIRGVGLRTVPAIDIDDASTGNAPLIDLDLTGIFTSNVIDFATTAANTGNIFYANLDNAVAMTAISLAGSGVRTQPFVELITDATGAADLIDISVDGAVTGDAIDIDLNLGLACRAMYIDAGNGTRTANLIDILHDGDGNVDVFGITSTNTGSGSIFDIDCSGATNTGAVFNVDMNAAVASPFMLLDYGAGTRTADMCEVTYDGDGTYPFWDIDISNTGVGAGTHYWDIDVSDVFTGSILDVVYSAAATGDCINLTMTSAVAAAALAINVAGVRTDDVIKIDSTDTGAAHCFDINYSSTHSGNILDITYSGVATGNAIDLNMGTNLAGVAIDLNLTGARTGAGVLFTDDSTGNAPAIDMNFDGIRTGNAIDITYATAAATENALDINMGTNVAGMAISVASAATGTSGEGACFDVEHTGNLGAGADAVTIHSTGSISSTSNLVAIEQDTGACTAGANALYVSATGTNCEGIYVAAGTTTLVEGIAGTFIRAGVTATAGPGAIAVTGSVHAVTTTGTGDAMTLANGVAGQRLSVIYVAEGAGADTAVITPTTLAGGATITLNNLGDSVDLIYHGTGGWYVLGLGGAAAVA